MADPLLVFDDLEMFLLDWFRSFLAGRPEPVCANVTVVRVEPEGEQSEWPEKLLVIRDDGTADGDIITGEASIGATVLMGSQENPYDAKHLARIIYGAFLQIPSGDPANPVASITSRNGPFLVPEPQKRARVYMTASLGVVARAT